MLQLSKSVELLPCLALRLVLNCKGRAVSTYQCLYCTASVETENTSLPKAPVCIARTEEFNFDHEVLLAWRNAVMKQSHDKNKHRVAVKLFQVVPGTSALLIHSGSKP